MDIHMLPMVGMPSELRCVETGRDDLNLDLIGGMAALLSPSTEAA
jgi:hypothetical protein